MDPFGGVVGRGWSIRTWRPEYHSGNESMENCKQFDKAGMWSVKQDTILNIEFLR